MASNSHEHDRRILGRALASELTAESHKEYALELKIAGGAIGGLPTNITKLFLAVNGNVFAELMSASMLAVAAKFPELAAYIETQLIKDYIAQFSILISQC
ncbi:uncharacterized protein BDZ99DRAFT_515717 [Mytilinidion resinicola]|uniref:Uncharacterized protein n=1 Tax=Mytilinidion resinicola TaxID=574789 RepID=A0A6A6Z2P7_9PEZI|nr:uncharacterized protein BDZ99DRAFT_515717 [Mytilinidion resinicola]KAF2814953.1 hypothetical protein BDZ99DRAFT_515717 [Mytilinidion resinicola]